MVQGTNPTNVKVAPMIERIRQTHLTFSKLIFYHVKRENNKEVDRLTNLITLKKEGCLTLNNIDTYQPIP